MRSRLVIFLFAIVSLVIMSNTGAYKKNMYQMDASGYYLYLPAIFIYHDLAHFSFYHDVNQRYQLSIGNDRYGLYNTPTGNLNDKYAIGTAVFELPFFLLAHSYSLLTHTAPADGYSKPYQLAGLIGNLFWVIAGLFFLRGLLRKYFDDGIVAFVLLCIAFGTNIYCYTVFQPGMSHPYGFFLFAGILYCADEFYTIQRSKYVYAIGLLLGMVLITRPVNIVVAILPLLWGVYDKRSLAERIQLLCKKYKALLAAAFIIFLVAMLQVTYWKYSTGQWIYYSYVDEGFNFLHPHIIDGLFSYQKGWFVYTPIALVSMIAVYSAWSINRKIVPAISIFFLLMFYVVFSWREWWYGGGFSTRALIETLPVVALPLGYLFRNIYRESKTVFIRSAFAVIMFFLITLNVFQSYQYYTCVIHPLFMNRPYYWRIFGRVSVPEADRRTMMTWDEYAKEQEMTKAGR